MNNGQTETELGQWDMVIEPHRHLLDLKLGDLWRYKAPGCSTHAIITVCWSSLNPPLHLCP